MGGCSGKFDAESVVPDKVPSRRQVEIEEPDCYQVSKPKEPEVEPIDENENDVGSLIYIHKYEPGLQTNGKRRIWLPVHISNGPRSKYVTVSGFSKTIRPTDDDGNFLYDYEMEPETFDAVHTFAVVQRVLMIYKRALAKLPGKYARGFKWPWGKAPLSVKPYAGRRNHASYQRSNHTLSFFLFEDKDTGAQIQTCQSFGAVAHEAGHAILDGIKPELNDASPNVETQAVQEAFADLTVLFGTLDFMDMCDIAMSKMTGDISNNNDLLQIAHELGLGHGKDTIHNLEKNLRVCDATEDRYIWSQVFTGAMYNILVAIVKKELDTSVFDPAATLYRSAKHVMSALLRAVIDAPANCRFKDLASGMVKGAESESVRKIMQREFTTRQFFDPCARPRPV